MSVAEEKHDERPRRSWPSQGSGGTAGTALVASIVTLWAAGGLPLRAEPDPPAPAPTPGPIVKIGKMFINIETITYVVDDPGGNLPPGSLQVNFASAGQNSIYLYNTQAESLRQALVRAGLESKAYRGPAGVRKPAAPKKAVQFNDPGE